MVSVTSATTLHAAEPRGIARRAQPLAGARRAGRSVAASWRSISPRVQSAAQRANSLCPSLRALPAPEAAGDAATFSITPDVDGIIPAFGPGSPPWPSVHADLRSAKFGPVRTVTPAQAAAMLRDDARAGLADVRPRIEFEEFRCGGDETSGASALNARNVPYFVPHRSAAKRWQGYFLCTKDGLKERDPTFSRSFREAFPDTSAPIIVGCKTGGSIAQAPVTVDPVTKRQVFPEGSSQYTDKSCSNSLMALYELQQAGYTNLFHLEGGVTEWCVSGEAHVGDPNAFYFHPTILPGILFQLIMVEGIVVRSNLAYVKQFHPENFETINQNNAAYGFINDLVANSPINWMFDYYS